MLAFFVKLLDTNALERAANSSVMMARPNLEAAIMGPRGAQPQAPPRGSQMICLMLAGALGGLPRGRVRDIGDAMLAVLRVTQGQGMQWLMESINKVPDSVATPDDKACSLPCFPPWA